MIVVIDKSFQKDVNKIADKKVKEAIVSIIEILQESKSINDVLNVKKLKGSKNAYRIRIGDYSLGLFYKNNEAELIRFLHRSQVYNKFP